MIFLAHGIGGVRDLPVPESFFFTTAAIVLVVSFVLLGLLWKRPLLEAHADGRSLPRALSAFFLSTATAGRPAGRRGRRSSLVTLATALFGTTTELLNFAPTFVYVIFWLGVPLLSILFGNVWRALSPWRAIADGAVWLLELGGREARPVLEWSGRWGRYPAAAALFSFVALELANPRPAYPRTLAIAIALYSYWALAGMAVYGRDAWTRGGEGFAVAFELLSRIAPFAVRDGRVIVRWPFTGLGGVRAGSRDAAFVAVMLGSTSFDGFSRTAHWQNLIGDIRADLADSSQRVIDLATTATNVVGTAFASSGGRADVPGGRSRCRGTVRHAPVTRPRLRPAPRADRRRLHGRALLLVLPHPGPVHHHAASDPFGRGWDLFGTVDFAPNLAIVAPDTVWYVQVSALVVGHVAGLAIAHDRAVTLFENRRAALRSQYPMLALMVLYTVGGLWVLSRG